MYRDVEDGSIPELVNSPPPNYPPAKFMEDSSRPYVVSSQYSPVHPIDEKKRVCGMRPWVLMLGILAALVIVVGAVLGGVFGTKATNNKNVDIKSVPISSKDSSANAATAGLSTIVSDGSTAVVQISTVTIGGSTSIATSTITDDATSQGYTRTSASAATRTSAATPSDTASNDVRFPGMAVSNRGPYDLKLFYVDSRTDDIIVHSYRDSDWENHGSLPGLNPAPKIGNGITVAYWLSVGGEEVRLYYVSESNKIIESVVDCPSSSSCDVTANNELPASNVSPSTSLAVVQWYRDDDTAQLRLYYVDTENEVNEVAYTGTAWQNAFTLGFSVAENSTISATMVNVKEFNRQWQIAHTTSNGDLAIWTIADFSRGSRTLLGYDTSSGYDETAVMAGCSIPRSTQHGYFERRISFVKKADNMPIEISNTLFSSSMQPWDDNVANEWRAADNGGNDGIACTAWKKDNTDGYHVRMYYPSGGKIIEMILDEGGAWYKGRFESK